MELAIVIGACAAVLLTGFFVTFAAEQRRAPRNAHGGLRAIKGGRSD